MRKILLAGLAGLALISSGCLTGGTLADKPPMVGQLAPGNDKPLV
jgi:hypothetical protein